MSRRYAEVVLAPPAGDQISSGIQQSFVQQKIIDSEGRFFALGRAASQDEKNPWMFH